MLVSLFADFHRCSKALSAKGQDVTPCDWYQRVYKSLCPISWVRVYDDLFEQLQEVQTFNDPQLKPVQIVPTALLQTVDSGMN